MQAVAEVLAVQWAAQAESDAFPRTTRKCSSTQLPGEAHCDGGCGRRWRMADPTWA